MGPHFITADVFAEHRFGGNQLAVFPDASKIAPEDFQLIAREFNYSETTFVLPPDNPSHAARVRIFSPKTEMPFAGHPTIGTAYVLARLGVIRLTGDEVRIVFEEGAGPVPVTIRAINREPHLIQLTAPKRPEIAGGSPDLSLLAELLSLEPSALDDARVRPAIVSSGIPFLLVPLTDADAVARARLNTEVYESLRRNHLSEKVFIFSLANDSESTVRARMFAPASGIPEDPATGSAAVALGGYLAMTNSLSTGTFRWTIQQGVEMGRPSVMEVEADKEMARVSAVRVGGRTVLVSEGNLIS